WGCTSGVYRHDDHMSLLRLLDWPYPGMGAHMVVALQSGKAGDFYNITWPGMTGVLTAMAPKRFSLAINMAPMRKHGWGYIGDWYKNRVRVGNQDGLPPAHLARKVCEEATDYAHAKAMLEKESIAAPVIF